MQCLFFIWRPGHHRSSEELQGLGKGVMGDSKFKNSNVHGSHSNIPNIIFCAQIFLGMLEILVLKIIVVYLLIVCVSFIIQSFFNKKKEVTFESPIFLERIYRDICRPSIHHVDLSITLWS